MRNFSIKQLKSIFIFFALMFLFMYDATYLVNVLDYISRHTSKSGRYYTVSTPDETISVPIKTEYEKKEPEKEYLYSFAWEVKRAISEGRPISEAIKDMDPDTVWLNIDELYKMGASIEDIHDCMPKDTIWLKVTELLQHGYDPDKLVEELYVDGSLRLVIDEFKANGYDTAKIKEKIH